RDLVAETYGSVNEFVRRAYLAVINRWPRSWGYVYRWLDHKEDFDKNFRRFSRLKNHFAILLDRFQPDVVVSTFPPFPYLLRRLVDLDIHLTVTVGHASKLRPAIEEAVGRRKIEIVGWTEELPRMLGASHLLIGKAGGATVQETIAAGCPMIINHVVSGQEEGNARLIVETNSGVIAHSPKEVVAQVRRAFADGAKQWCEWAVNISRLSRPRASLEIAEFLS